MANASQAPAEGLLLHGVTDAQAAGIIGPRMAEFAGVPVRAVKQGGIAALVSAAPPPSRLQRWLSWMHKPSSAAPVLSALSSMMPMLPVAPRTVFASEASLRSMMLARESELSALIAENASLLECDLMAGFDPVTAEVDLATQGPLALLRGETDSEKALIQKSVAQSVSGRQAMFLARLNRRVVDGAIDILTIEAPNKPDALRRRVLIERGRRAAFRASLRSLADEVGLGAWLRMGPYLPPISFRRLEISSADAGAVNAARAALGVDEAAERGSIRTAYNRTLERCYPRVAEAERRQRLAHLESLFGLLDRVAEGQIKAARGAGTMIRFDPDALKDTWLLRLHRHDLADRAA